LGTTEDFSTTEDFDTTDDFGIAAGGHTRTGAGSAFGLTMGAGRDAQKGALCETADRPEIWLYSGRVGEFGRFGYSPDELVTSEDLVSPSACFVAIIVAIVLLPKPHVEGGED
jgi:hypothetical protein